jgi:hypothetical protein
MLRQDVIREIVKRDDQERGLAEELVIEEAKGLHEAACEYFGVWTKRYTTRNYPVVCCAIGVS